MFRLVTSLTRRQKRAIFLVLDVALVVPALLAALALQANTLMPLAALSESWRLLPLLMAAAAALSLALGIPNIRLNAYESRAVLRAALFAALLGVAGAAIGRLAAVALPAGTHVVFALVFFLASAASRVAMLQSVLAIYRRARPRRRVLIYGAGTTGLQLATALRADERVDAVAFLDDSPALQGLVVAGLPVLSPVRVCEIAAERGVERVILAMPSLSQPKQTQIARRLERMRLEVQALPSFAQLIGEEALVEKLTPVRPGSLLGRARLDHELTGGCEAYAGASVLVSGAGGSIGAELCRQVLACRPARLVLYELSELALYNVDMELRQLAEETGTEIVAVLGSVTDSRLVRRVLAEQAVGVVLHSAAYKHVPLVENNPVAGLANNVLGTRTLALAAREAGVARFTLISSDKAVRPVGVMGASKRLAELVVGDLATRPRNTVFSTVRFGNVLGTSGSVVPLFQEQIARGGPVTLTHAEVTRYFMTLEEAGRLVLVAGGFAQGGETFVLDMGAPVAIRDLARQVIEASGYTVRDADTPDGDIEIATTGLRCGEKLHEELLMGERLLTTAHPKIRAAREAGLSEIGVAGALRALRLALASGDAETARRVALRWAAAPEPIPASVPAAPVAPAREMS